MTTVRIVCRPAVGPGFGLAGLEYDPVDAAEPPEAWWPRLAGQPEVVLLQDDIYETLPAELRARLDRSARPLVVPFPGPAWQVRATAEERVIELLRRAIGYRVRLR